MTRNDESIGTLEEVASKLGTTPEALAARLWGDTPRRRPAAPHRNRSPARGNRGNGHRPTHTGKTRTRISSLNENWWINDDGWWTNGRVTHEVTPQMQANADRQARATRSTTPRQTPRPNDTSIPVAGNATGR